MLQQSLVGFWHKKDFKKKPEKKLVRKRNIESEALLHIIHFEDMKWWPSPMVNPQPRCPQKATRGTMHFAPQRNCTSFSPFTNYENALFFRERAMHFELSWAKQSITLRCEPFFSPIRLKDAKTPSPWWTTLVKRQKFVVKQYQVLHRRLDVTEKTTEVIYCQTDENHCYKHFKESGALFVRGRTYQKQIPKLHEN